MEYSAVIPCGGIGSRLNLGYNKIIYKTNDKLLIEYTIKNFLLDEECKEVVIVSNKADLEFLKSVIKHSKVKFTLGGNTREESVQNGLKIASFEYVLIHDGARPNVSKELINRVKEKLNEVDYVIPTLKLKDASLINDKYHQEIITIIQTPQATKRSLLLEAMDNLDITKKIDRFEKEVDKEIIKLAKELLEFGKKNIELLKPYL